MIKGTYNGNGVNVLCVGRKKGLSVDLNSQIIESRESLKNKVVHFESYGVATSPIRVVLKTNYETWRAFEVISGRFKLHGRGGPVVSVFYAIILMVNYYWLNTV